MGTLPYVLSSLEKLQSFKIPFTKLYERFVFSYSLFDITDDDLCEYCLLYDGSNEFYAAEKDVIDREIIETVEKLAKLLEVKESRFKEELLKYLK